MAVKKEQPSAAVKTANKKDTGSSSVQVSIFTKRISELTEHLKLNKHDYMARRGLLQLVGKRRRHLKYLADNDPQQYLKVVKDLGLRH